ncbi:MAG: GeoRSP system radical SAM/SPASM protein [Polyangiales bacterium]
MTKQPLRARAERFGAWVRLDDHTLVALDRDAAHSLHLDPANLWCESPTEGISGVPVAPLELHVAVTSRCPATCEGCYLDARADGTHVEEEVLERTLSAASKAGVFTVAFGGGEPLTHPALPRLAERARAHGLTPVVTTSGIGMTVAKANALRSFAQVNVSYDGDAEAYAAVRGFDGARVAERAIELLAEQGIPVGVNVVLTRHNFGVEGDTLVSTCRRAASLGAREAQLLRYKPAGRAASLDYLTQRLTRAQVSMLPEVVRRIVALGELSLRIDCAMVPLLSTAFEDPQALMALGVMGCEAGSALAAITVHGRVSPCSFTSDTTLTPDDIGAAWARDRARSVEPCGDALSAFRAYADAPDEPCASCPIRVVCRGGCKVVTGHLGPTPFAPDPECPRVLAHRAAAFAAAES